MSVFSMDTEKALDQTEQVYDYKLLVCRGLTTLQSSDLDVR